MRDSTGETATPRSGGRAAPTAAAAAGAVSLAEATRRLLPAAAAAFLSARAVRQAGRALSPGRQAPAAAAAATVFVVQILLMISITSSTQLNAVKADISSTTVAPAEPPAAAWLGRRVSGDVGGKRPAGRPAHSGREGGREGVGEWKGNRFVLVIHFEAAAAVAERTLFLSSSSAS